MNEGRQLNDIPVYKMLVVGDCRVGKTSLLTRFTGNWFPGGPIYGNGLEFKVRTIRLDGAAIKLMIWDTSGGERFRFIYRAYWKVVSGVLFIYDVTSQTSYNRVKMWLKLADVMLDKDSTSWQLVGNKCDLTTKREVDYETAKTFADQMQIPLVETSAKDSTNVDLAFVQLAANIKMKRSEGKMENDMNIQLQSNALISSAGNCTVL